VETKEANFSPYLILLQSDRSQSFSFCIPFFDPEIAESSSDMALHFHGQHAPQFHLVPYPCEAGVVGGQSFKRTPRLSV
jgi:hypothetical protein